MGVQYNLCQRHRWPLLNRKQYMYYRIYKYHGHHYHEPRVQQASFISYRMASRHPLGDLVTDSTSLFPT